MRYHNIFLLLLSFTLFSFKTDFKKHEKNKTIHKEYSVSENTTVYINNKYGNIYVTTWDENKVDVTVKITVKGSDLEKVNDKLNAIDIKFENSNSLVEARTYIEKIKSNIETKEISFNLIFSFCHMSLNRLYRTNSRKNEFISYDLLFFYYKSMVARLKYNKKRL